jgi:hypothetical protein
MLPWPSQKEDTMLKHITLAALIAVPMFANAADKEPQHEQALPRVEAPAKPVANTPAPKAEKKTSHTMSRSILAACQKKVADSGVKGEAAKAAVNDCMKAS